MGTEVELAIYSINVQNLCRKYSMLYFEVLEYGKIWQIQTSQKHFLLVTYYKLKQKKNISCKKMITQT